MKDFCQAKMHKHYVSELRKPSKYWNNKIIVENDRAQSKFTQHNFQIHTTENPKTVVKEKINCLRKYRNYPRALWAVRPKQTPHTSAVHPEQTTLPVRPKQTAPLVRRAPSAHFFRASRLLGISLQLGIFLFHRPVAVFERQYFSQFWSSKFY